MPDSPLDETLWHTMLPSVTRVFWDPRDRGFFQRLRAIPRRLIEAAIRRRSTVPIVGSQHWRKAVLWAFGAHEPVEDRLLRGALRSGLRELPATRLGPMVGEIAAQHAAPRAVSLIQAVDGKTRLGISRMISSASQAYAKQPSAATIRRLTSEISNKIGLTPWQNGVVNRGAARLRNAGKVEAEVQKWIADRSQRFIVQRSGQIADRAIIESVGFGRHQAWVEAMERGEIPETAMKRWMTQGDDAVRVRHREQARVGAIPLKEVFAIMGVMHAPSDEFG